MRDRRNPVARCPPSANGQRPDKHRASIDNDTLEEQCHPRKIFIGGLAHKTTTQHLRDHFGRFGAIVDAVVLRWPDGRSRGFGYVTFADANAAASVLQETHQLSSREVDVKRAVPGTNKLFIGGLPQNTTANELREHFEKFGIVSDAVVMIDPATSRSRGFGFVCFLPGHEGAAAVTTALQQYDNHRIRGKWIEVKNAAPPHKLTTKSGGQDDAPSNKQTCEEISLAGALLLSESNKLSPSLSPSPSVENYEPNQPPRVMPALGSPRKVALPKGVARQPESGMESSEPVARLPWWTPDSWGTRFDPGYGMPSPDFGGQPPAHGGYCPPPGIATGRASAEYSRHLHLDEPMLTPSENLQRSLEIFLRQTMQNKMELGVVKGTPSESTTCSAATPVETAASFSVEN